MVGGVFLNIAICEDERVYQQHIESLIYNLNLSERIDLDIFSSGEDLVNAYRNNRRYSIILLDMQMKELGGIETAEIVRTYDKNCIIIIITAIIEYAVEGYSINAFNFILKPINEEKFNKILLNAIHKVKFFDHQTYIIETREKTIVLLLSDILYVESSARKVVIYGKDSIYESNENISSVEAKLEDQGFVRISRYYLINLRYVKEIRFNEILLLNDISLSYSKKFASDIKKKYMIYMMEAII